MKRKPRLSIHNLSRGRHQAALRALAEASEHVGRSHEVDGVIIILAGKGQRGPRVITAGSLDAKSQAILALAQTQLGLLTKPQQE